jgi:hypothetical protein
MKLNLLPFACLLGGAISAPVTLDERQSMGPFPSAAQSPPQYQVQQKATGALIKKAWDEVGQTYIGMSTAMKCVHSASPASPPPSLFLNCGVGEAHKAIVNKLLETQSRFAPNAAISIVEASTTIIQVSATLTMNQQTAFKAIGDNWALSVRTGERHLVYESLTQQLSLYESWAKVFNALMPMSAKKLGTEASGNIVSQYQTLIKKYQWDVPT